ncbi:ERVV1 protein, partial [Galbula dea]|nr:ERVV1 protein [Galbula dea]
LSKDGGVCTVINSTCCTYMDQGGRIATDLQEIWTQTKTLHAITQDDTSWGFSELWHKLTSWLPNFTWLKQLFALMVSLLVLGIMLCVLLRCFFWCCQGTGDAYTNWKKWQL